MKNLLISFLTIITLTSAAQQIAIPRIDEMPDFPHPYDMRDWDQVAQHYDSVAFDMSLSGTYLPLTTIIQNSINYPEHNTFGLQTYVGTNSPPGREAINLIPAVVGATLVGIDKSEQFGHNWVLYCEEFFNKKPEENVYLNGPNTSTGHDWWYETMPNVFFYQLNWFYPHTGDFDYQVSTVASRWLQAVEAMGGDCAPWTVPYMNYRAFKLSTMTPLETGVKQAEAAGAIGWILYQAYTITGQEEYRIGAEWCLEFLNAWPENPSYEIQMPYGAYIAARMNAELGTDYDVEKMINWCFDRNLQRGWGAIIGQWGEIDMSGLIGEVNSTSFDYVFNMNSLEQFGALVPMVRYDDRFASAIAKWSLNVANATRFYYSAYLPDDMQDNEAWSQEYDTEAVIAYESLRERDSGPYGTGDAMDGGWAETNLCMYGSSHIGILGGIIKKTNTAGILQMDLLATDYYHTDAYPSYLVYNPYESSKTIQLGLPPGNHDIYDALTNQVILENVTSSTNIQFEALSTMSLVYLPAGSEITYVQNKAFVNGICIDYNAGIQVENYPPRIKCLTAIDSIALTGTETMIYCTAEDHETAELEYQWWVEGVPMAGEEMLLWEVPDTSGTAEIICQVNDAGDLSATDTLMLRIVEKINYPPEILSIKANSSIIPPGGSTSVSCEAFDKNGDSLTYVWQVTEGQINGSTSIAEYYAPDHETNVYIVCEVIDIDSLSVRDSVLVLVRDPDSGQTGDLIAWYPFNGSCTDITGNSHDGTALLCSYINDQLGNSRGAINLYSTSSSIDVPNDEELNFRDGLSVSIWLNVDQHYEREAYPISHGNWTTRWKLSIGDQKLRFTINGEGGIIDLDSKTLLEEDTWYHVAAVYNGQECMLFINGVLEAFTPFIGKINTTPYDLVFGQALPDQSGFDYDGAIDNTRIYDYGLTYEMIKEIYEGELYSVDEISGNNDIRIYPNPSSGKVNIDLGNHHDIVEVNVHDIMGRSVYSKKYINSREIMLELDGQETGLYFIEIISDGQVLAKRKLVLNFDI